MNNYNKSTHIKYILRTVYAILAACLVLEVSVLTVFALSPERRYIHSLNLGNKYLLSLDYEDAAESFLKCD